MSRIIITYAVQTGAPASETYAIFIVVGSDWQGVDGSITTEENGKGAGYAEQMIPESQILEDNTINVKIVVRPEPGTSEDGWASQIVNIPVKTICEDY